MMAKDSNKRQYTHWEDVSVDASAMVKFGLTAD
jgi:hypothetical protein